MLIFPAVRRETGTASTRETKVTQVTVMVRPIPESHPARAPLRTGKNDPAMQMAK